MKRNCHIMKVLDLVNLMATKRHFDGSSARLTKEGDLFFEQWDDDGMKSNEHYTPNEIAYKFNMPLW